MASCRRGGPCRCQAQSDKSDRFPSLGARFRFPWADEKQQLAHRLGTPLIRHVLTQFRAQQLDPHTAAAKLQLSRSRFYELYADSLRAGPERNSGWSPGPAGGDHAPDWPADVVALLHKRRAAPPPANDSFAASEVLRLCDFPLARAQGRRWASENHRAHAKPNLSVSAPIRRWQRSQPGERWQLDASPHRWFPACKRLFPMLNMLDACSRLFPGSKRDQHENRLADYDFLPAAFHECGLPLERYVAVHSFFFPHGPAALTQLGQALRFDGVNFLYAPPPSQRQN